MPRRSKVPTAEHRERALLREHFNDDGTPKRGYRSSDEARAVALAQQAAMGSNRRPYHWYRCSTCGLWKVGRKPPPGKRH